MRVIFEMKIFVVRHKKYLHRFHTPWINQYVTRKISLCFFGVIKRDQIFPSNVCHFQSVIDSFLVEK